MGRSSVILVDLYAGYSFPYVIAILSKFVEVRTTSQALAQTSQTLVQTIPLKMPRLLAIKDNTIYVAAQSNVWKLLSVSMSSQVDQLVNDKEYEEALLLCENMNDADEERVRELVVYSYRDRMGR